MQGVVFIQTGLAGNFPWVNAHFSQVLLCRHALISFHLWQALCVQARLGTLSSPVCNFSV